MSASVSLALSSSAHTRSASSLPRGKLAGGWKLTDITILAAAEVGLLDAAEELEALPGRLIELRPLPGLLEELRGGELEPIEWRLMSDECREGGGVRGGA